LFRSLKTLPGRIFARPIMLVVVACLLAAPSTRGLTAQDREKPKPPDAKKEDIKLPDEKELEKNRKKQEAAGIKLSKVESIVEIAILAYGGRKQLETVRSSAEEQGTIRLAVDQGDVTGNFQLRTLRKEKTWDDLLRVDLDLTNPEALQRQGAPKTVKYVIAFNGASVWSAQNGQYVTPRAEAEAAFRAQLTHEYMALLRYKEDGSKIEFVAPETISGIDTQVVDLVNTKGEKTRFWVSAKTYHVLHAEYELQLAEGKTTKYKIHYYYSPYRVFQNTLLPTRRLMEQDGKFVQEVMINAANYSAKLDPEIFQHLQE